MMNKIKAIVITGPTATGKTSLAVKLALRLDGEIVSADSRQVYKGLDIGSGKDLSEYTRGGSVARHHLIDILSPDKEYSLKDFCVDAPRAMRDISSRGRVPILCGGTALYVHSLLMGHSLPGGPRDEELRKSLESMSLDELRAAHRRLTGSSLSQSDESNRNRLARAIERASSPSPQVTPANENFDFLVIGVFFPRDEIYRRIESRLDERLAHGLVEEVEALHNSGLGWEKLEWFGLEYRHAALFLQGRMSRGEMRDTLLKKIRHFAKSQEVWFRKMEREGVDIHWLDGGNFDECAALSEAFLSGAAPQPPKRRMSDTLYGPRSN